MEELESSIGSRLVRTASENKIKDCAERINNQALSLAALLCREVAWLRDDTGPGGISIIMVPAMEQQHQQATAPTTRACESCKSKQRAQLRQLQIRIGKAQVRKPVMSVCDLVNNSRAVVFDSSGAYGVHKKTGMRNESAWRGREWELTVDLEATAKAEEAVKKYTAELQALHSRAVDPVDVPGGAGNAPVETVGSGVLGWQRWMARKTVQ